MPCFRHDEAQSNLFKDCGGFLPLVVVTSRNILPRSLVIPPRNLFETFLFDIEHFSGPELCLGKDQTACSPY